MFLALIKKLHMFGSWKEWKEELEDCSQHDIKYKTGRMNYKLARENFDKISKSGLVYEKLIWAVCFLSS